MDSVRDAPGGARRAASIATARSRSATRVRSVQAQRQRDDVFDGLARIERRVRVLEHDLHAARAGARSSRAGGAVRSAPSKRTRPESAMRCRTARPSVHLPQPDSPIRPSVSPRGLEAHPIDRVHAGGRATEQTGPRGCGGEAKCFDHALDAQQAAWSSGTAASPHASASGKRVVIAIGEWHASGACAAGIAAGTGIPVGVSIRLGKVALDRLYAVAGSSGRGIEASRPCVYGCRAAPMTCAVGPLSTTCPAYITSTRAQCSATTPEVVRDQHDAHAEARCAAMRSGRAPAPGS